MIRIIFLKLYVLYFSPTHNGAPRPLNEFWKSDDCFVVGNSNVIDVYSLLYKYAYLNDNFKGGRTLLQDKMIDTEVGKVIVFNSQKMEHGVEEVIGDRFTYISWWKKQR